MQDEWLLAGLVAGAFVGGFCVASLLRDRNEKEKKREENEQSEQNAIHYDSPFIGALDQGTSSTRFIIFDAKRRQVVSHQMELAHVRPFPG
jgi:hypothetical protein